MSLRFAGAPGNPRDVRWLALQTLFTDPASAIPAKTRLTPAAFAAFTDSSCQDYTDLPEPLTDAKRTRQSGRGQGRTVIVARVLLLWSVEMTVYAVLGSATYRILAVERHGVNMTTDGADDERTCPVQPMIGSVGPSRLVERGEESGRDDRNLVAAEGAEVKKVFAVFDATEHRRSVKAHPAGELIHVHGLGLDCDHA